MLYCEISVSTFEREWRTIHDAVFNGRPVHEQPFLNRQWERLLVPYGLSMEPPVFDALARAAGSKHDAGIVICNSEALEPQPAASIGWTYKALDEVRCSLLGHFETHIFGSSGSWGLVCAVNDFSCIGGEPDFVDVLAIALGGRDALKERFHRFEAIEWQMPQEFRLKLLKMVGWE